MPAETSVLPYTAVFIRLLKGPVEYLETNLWEKLLRYRNELQSFMTPLGLTLVLDESDGYAYARHAYGEDEEPEVIWMQRRPFTYDESIMLVLLREMMAEFETGEATTRELLRKRHEIKEYAALFFREGASRVRFMKDIDRLIDKMAEYGFLELTETNESADEERFRIRKLIKARVNAEALEDFIGQLRETSKTGAGQDMITTPDPTDILPSQSN
jgi:hypothetical protein